MNVFLYTNTCTQAPPSPPTHIYTQAPPSLPTHTHAHKPLPTHTYTQRTIVDSYQHGGSARLPAGIRDDKTEAVYTREKIESMENCLVSILKDGLDKMLAQQFPRVGGYALYTRYAYFQTSTDNRIQWLCSHLKQFGYACL